MEISLRAVPDGNDALRHALPQIVSLIVETALWVHPDVYNRLPVWAPYTARGQPLYNSSWTRPQTNTRRATQATVNKVEGNTNAAKVLRLALGISGKKPKNWTVCHIWGYDDTSFAQHRSVVHDHRYFSCVANMIWLPTALKGFTDSFPEVKNYLRTCAFHTYGWVCESDLVTEEAREIKSGQLPKGYPDKWPTQNNRVLPPGTMPVTKRVERNIERQRDKIRSMLGNQNLTNFPRDRVKDVLAHWNVTL